MVRRRMMSHLKFCCKNSFRYFLMYRAILFVAWINIIQQKFKTHSRSAEFAYNFLDSLKKYSFDSDVKLFDLILHGELPEEVTICRINWAVSYFVHRYVWIN